MATITWRKYSDQSAQKTIVFSSLPTYDYLVKSPLKQILLSEGIRQSGFSIFGNFLATGLSAVSLIIISRLLGPVGFGEFSVGFAIVLILNRINDAGLNATIIRYVSQSHQDTSLVNGIFSYTLRIKLYLSLLIILVGLVLAPFLTRALDFSQPAIIYLAFGLSIFATWYEQLASMLQALHRFSQAVVINALQAGFKLAGAVVFFGLGLPNSVLLFILYTLGPIVPLLFAHKLLPSWTKLRLRANLSHEKNMIKELAMHSSVNFISAGLIENIDVLFVQHYLTTFETGLLAGVSRIAMMLQLIAYSLGNVLFARVARYREKKDMKSYLKKASLLSLGSLLGFVFFWPFAKLTIWLTIGPDYIEGVSILYILAFSSFITIATIPFMALFYSFKANWYFSVSGLLQLAIILLGNVILVPEYGLEAAAWVKLSARLALFVLTVGAGLVLYQRQYWKESAHASS